MEVGLGRAEHSPAGEAFPSCSVRSQQGCFSEGNVSLPQFSPQALQPEAFALHLSKDLPRAVSVFAGRGQQGWVGAELGILSSILSLDFS